MTGRSLNPKSLALTRELMAGDNGIRFTADKPVIPFEVKRRHIVSSSSHTALQSGIAANYRAKMPANKEK